MTCKIQKANYQQNTEKKESAKQLIDCGLQHHQKQIQETIRHFHPSNSKCKKAPHRCSICRIRSFSYRNPQKTHFFPYLPFALSVGMRIFVG